MTRQRRTSFLRILGLSSRARLAGTLASGPRRGGTGGSRGGRRRGGGRSGSGSRPTTRSLSVTERNRNFYERPPVFTYSRAVRVLTSREEAAPIWATISLWTVRRGSGILVHGMREIASRVVLIVAVAVPAGIGEPIAHTNDAISKRDENHHRDRNNEEGRAR